MWKEKFRKFLPKHDTEKWKKILFWIAAGAVGLFLAGIILFALLIVVLSIGLPNVTDLKNLNAAQSTEIYDREGELLYTIHGEEDREEVSLEEIAPTLIEATVSLEDGDFYEHSGFDIWALGKVGLYEVFGIGTPRGGSTITQQYVKNTFLSAERSYTRKAQELILALRLERAFDKNQILELYLNRIPYGNNAYGIQKAAEIYFDKNAADLNLAESVILAALPQAPSRYNPYGDNRNSHLLKDFTVEELEGRNIETVEDLEIEEHIRGLIGQNIELANGKTLYLPGRTDLALMFMEREGKITKAQKEETLAALQTIEFNQNFKAFQNPHFVLYVKEQLEEKYGKDVVEQGGLKVYTTLDSELQSVAEETAFKQGEANEKNFNANNVAILTINAKSGEILAMVGSRDYANDEIDGKVNVVFRPRQPGSSFKPIVYAQAFYNGYAPGNIIYDVPTTVGPNRPSNYDGQFQGQISVRRALAQSRNIPAIKAYYLAGGQDSILDLAEKMGITTLNSSHDYGYPLALGAGEVPLSEMVTAYATFASGGKKPELNSILKVENANGDILEEWEQREFEEVLDPQVAFLINSILSDKGQAVGSRLFVNGKTNAAKTGTSTKENKQDAGGSVRPSDGWVIGYTPTIVTGVWIGNTDGTGMSYNADGYTSASGIWNTVMTKALAKMPNEPFPVPEGIKKISISKASGKLPSANTPQDFLTADYFASFAVPTEVEKSFVEVEIDRISGLLATEYTPEAAREKVVYQNLSDIADMFNWNAEVRAYYQDSTDIEAGVRLGLPPSEYDNIHTAQTALRAPSIVITNPVTQGEISEGNLQISVEVTAENGIETVEYYIDDEKKYFTSTAPYTGNILISRFFQPGSKHLIVAKVIDSMGYSAQSAVEVKVSRKKEDDE